MYLAKKDLINFRLLLNQRTHHLRDLPVKPDGEMIPEEDINKDQNADPQASCVLLC